MLHGLRLLGFQEASGEMQLLRAARTHDPREPGGIGGMAASRAAGRWLEGESVEMLRCFEKTLEEAGASENKNGRRGSQFWGLGDQEQGTVAACRRFNANNNNRPRTAREIFGEELPW